MDADETWGISQAGTLSPSSNTGDKMEETDYLIPEETDCPTTISR